MAHRVSHSLLDPWISPPVRSVYGKLRIPSRFPPEGIIAVGHLLSIVAAIGLAVSTRVWWGGVLVAIGVAGNHVADILDGTHARASGQCRNGGELLDHFTDPLSFSYWLVGLAVSCSRLDLGLVAVIVLYATAVLTNIRAKMIGEFALASFGPTEFKTLLVVYGLCLAVMNGHPLASRIALGFYIILIAVGIIQLVVSLVQAVRQVNAHGQPADTTEWVTTRADRGGAGE